MIVGYVLVVQVITLQTQIKIVQEFVLVQHLSMNVIYVQKVILVWLQMQIKIVMVIVLAKLL